LTVIGNSSYDACHVAMPDRARQLRAARRNRGVDCIALVRPPSDYNTNFSAGDFSQCCNSILFSECASRLLILPEQAAHTAIASSLRHCGTRLRTALLNAPAIAATIL